VDHDLRAAAVSQQLFDRRAVFDLHRKEHAPRRGGNLLIVLLREFVQNLGGGGAGDAFEEIVLLADEASFPYLKDRDTGGVLSQSVAENIGVLAARGDYSLATQDDLEGVDLIADAGGGLVTEVTGGPVHLGAELREHVLVLAVEEVAHLADRSAILLRSREALRARPQTAFNVVLEAGTRPIASLRLPGAAPALLDGGHEPLANAEEAAGQADSLPHALGGGIGAEVARPIGAHAPDDAQAGKWLPWVYPDVGVALVITIANIEPRLVLLDQRELEDESFHARVGDNEVKVLDLLNEKAKARGEVSAP